MLTQFDEKGKIFTNVISKKPVMVTIQTSTNKIHGEIYVRPNERIKDELDRSEQFIAVTNAIVYSPQDVEVYRSNFLTLNLNHIVWLIPDDEVHSE
jgi:hypothetical protein